MAASLALSDHFVAAGDIRLHYVTAGSGPCMLFLHGFPEYWAAWRAQFEAFAPTHRVVAPDLRGYNLSDAPAAVERYRMPELVADIGAVAAAVTAEPFTLVAHDWGGAIAWQFALTYPERLARLVILNAPHPATFARELASNPAQRQASDYMLLLRDRKAERVLAADGFRRLARLSIDAWGATEEERAGYLAAWSRPGALTGMLNYYRAARLFPGAPMPSLDPVRLRIDVPTHVIWGEADTALLTGNLDGLAEWVPDLKIDRIAAGTHWLVHERPAEVNALIRAAIAGG